METAVKPNTRNQSMDCCKLIAAIFVVLIHVPLPGNLGKVLSTLGRFAVPVFFAISGYYSCRVGEGRLKKRVWHILWLNVLATLVCLGWDCVDAWLKGVYIWSYLRERLTLSVDSLVRWAVVQINPYGGHLWYLGAILLCYIALWAYQRFWSKEEDNYKPLYILSAGLLLFNVTVGELSGAVGLEVSNKLVRNFWFFGLPMFSMGLFLRQYREKIMTNYRLNGWKLAVLTVLGALASVWQRFTIGTGDLPVGMLLTAPALMLLMAQYPALTRKPRLQRVFALFGDMATSIYVIHLVFLSLYENHLAIHLDRLLADRAIMTPLFTVTASVVSSLILQILIRCAKRCVHRGRTAE